MRKSNERHGMLMVRRKKEAALQPSGMGNQPRMRDPESGACSWERTQAAVVTLGAGQGKRAALE